MILRRTLLAAAWMPVTMARAQRGGAQAEAAASDAIDLRWSDARRQRNLPLRLRLPAGTEPVALVLFSHGLGGSVAAGTRWARAWSQAGIATLHLQHPGSDTEVLRQGLSALRAAADAVQLQARCEDVRFVLDEIARRQAVGEPALQRLRLDAVGMAGHSFGAHTTLALAGQDYGPGVGAAMRDARPRAFAAFSPSPGRRDAGAASRSFGGITRPMLCLTGSLDGDPLSLAPGSQDRAGQGAWRRAVYDALPPGAKAELWLEAADHMSFGGQDWRPGGAFVRRTAEATRAQAPRHDALIESTSTAWWRAHLLGDTIAREALMRPPSGLGPQDEWRRA